MSDDTEGMAPNERALWDQLERLTRRDAEEAANEVPVVFTREQAGTLKRIVRWAMLEAANPYTKGRAPVAYERSSAIHDLITAAMREKGMLDGDR